MLPQQQSLSCFTYLNVPLTLFMDKLVILKMDGNIKVKRAISITYKSRSSVVLITCPDAQVQFSVLIAQLKVLKSSEWFPFTFLLSTNYRVLNIDVFWGKQHKLSVVLAKRFTRIVLKFKRKMLMRNQIFVTVRVVIYI